jgi:hypothetical protein
MGSIHEKTRGRNSRSTVPLKPFFSFKKSS